MSGNQNFKRITCMSKWQKSEQPQVLKSESMVGADGLRKMVKSECKNAIKEMAAASHQTIYAKQYVNVEYVENHIENVCRGGTGVKHSHRKN